MGGGKGRGGRGSRNEVIIVVVSSHIRSRGNDTKPREEYWPSLFTSDRETLCGTVLSTSVFGVKKWISEEGKMKDEEEKRKDDGEKKKRTISEEEGEKKDEKRKRGGKGGAEEEEGESVKRRREKG